MVYIKTIILEGCQSHDKTQFDFIPGLNVIVAPNNAGKSVLFKMIKATASPNFFDRKERRSLIRRGRESASIIYIFSDGSSGAMRVMQDKIVYYYTEDYSTIPYTATLTPDLKLLHNLSLIVDKSGTYIANVMDPDQDLLFVKTSNSTNNNLVELMVSDPRIDTLLLNLKSKKEQYKADAEHIERMYNVLIDRVGDSKPIDVLGLKNKEEICTASVEVLDMLGEASRYLENMKVVEELNYNFLIFLCDLVHNFKGLELNYICEKEDSRILEISDNILEAYLESKLIKVNKEETLFSVSLILSEVIEDLSNLHVDSFRDEIFSFVDIYIELDRALEEISTITELNNGIGERDIIISEMEKELNAIARRVPCVIYGEVQHLDGECIPVNNRSPL